MPHLCNARGLDGRTCFDCQPVDTTGPIVIHASVGRGGFNRSGDTRVIQAGLNDLDPSEGGPDPLLAEDSVVGPLTTAAIHDFQVLHFGRAGFAHRSCRPCTPETKRASRRPSG